MASATGVYASGVAAGQRSLLGPQTSGRAYRNLSPAEHRINALLDVAIPMRDGTVLRADTYLPETDQPVPALVAVSPYPRQAQYLGLPAGMIEAGQTDFWVPRGYAHVIVNVRGTCGSQGTYRLGGTPGDLFDIIEWVAAQSWCSGKIGMIGVSYFAIEQYNAALEHPPHLAAIFPWSGSVDWYREIVRHGGIFSGRFFGMYFGALGMVSKRGGTMFRRRIFHALNRVLRLTPVHRRFEHPPKDQLRAFNRVLRLDYEPDPWDEIYLDIAVRHELFDDYWTELDLTPRLNEIDIPVYTGGDWANPAFHLAAPFVVWEQLTRAPLRIVMPPRGSLQWPWESMHAEALAWYDHWLKGHDTGILDGPPIRYFLHGADTWEQADTWPPNPDGTTSLVLSGTGRLGGPTEGKTTSYLYLPATSQRGRNANPPRLPAGLSWQTEPFAADTDLIGPSVLHLVAATTAADTDWFVKLRLLPRHGTPMDLTQGWLRASHREVDDHRSTPLRPYHPHTRRLPVPHDEPIDYDIEILPTAQRIKAGERLELQ
ncbi:MAG TPA: CocE/NonD family hydrolase, partial [Mycobacterium sp.]|nr:CocE/NonD family hydrolase [Mycobacterium sp.]